MKFYVEKCQFESNRKLGYDQLIKNKEEITYQDRCFRQIDYQAEEILVNSNQFIEEEQILDTCKSLRPDVQEENNKTLVQAKILDRTFVSRGDVIDVYHTDTDDWDELCVNIVILQNYDQHICSLPPLKTFKDQKITPKKIIMHQDDTKMILLDQNNNKYAYNLDLEKGEIYQELQIDKENSIFDMTSEIKHGDLIGDNFFLAMNQRNLFQLDTRLQNPVVANKIYQTNNLFSSITTNNNKNIIVGSETGEIRLFDQIGKNAKNVFAGMGDNIISIDTTKDGKFILATCKQYLILLPAIFGNFNSYTQTIKYNERKISRKLTLSPTDIAKYKIKNIEFTPARFDDSKQGLETFIVTSVEKYLIIWNIKKVLQGKIDQYQIKAMQNLIVNSEYKFDNNSNVLVETLNELRIQKFKNK